MRWILACVLVCALTIWAGIRIGYPRFKQYQRDKIVRSASGFFQTKDYRSAYLLLEPLTKREPENFAARRLFARVLETFDMPQALDEWATLMKYEPANPENHVGYVTLALSTGHLNEAVEALAKLEKLTPHGADYYRLSAAAALARRDSPALRQAMEGLVRVEEDNLTARFGLASLQINSGKADEVATARATLEEFSRGERVRIRSTLVLLEDLPRRWPEKSPGQAQRLLARQLGLGLAVRGGEKQYLWAGLRDQHEPDLEDIVQHMQNQPAPAAEDVAALAGWMIEQRKAREALVWLESLETSLRTSPAVLNAMAGCALATDQWVELEKHLVAGAWGPVPAEAVHYAFEAKRVRDAGNESKAESLWNSAVVLSETSMPGLRLLVRLAAHWRWPRKLEQALWQMAQQFPEEDDAWRKLSVIALNSRETAKIWRVYSAWAQADPSNQEVRINRAVLGIFVRPNEPGLADEIVQLLRASPENPGCRIAQAMVDWRAGRFAEALARLDQIAIKPADEPRLALARGLVLASLGRVAAAETNFQMVSDAALLPEEKLLIQQARRRT